MFSQVILYFPLIQKGQLLVSNHCVHKFWLTASKSKPAQKNMSRWTDLLNMNLTVLTGP